MLRRFSRQSETLSTVTLPQPTFTQPRLNPAKNIITFAVCLDGSNLGAGHYAGAIAVEGPGELLERQQTSREAGPAAKRHARRPTHGAVTLHEVIISPAVVRRLVAAIDALPIVQPGAWVCPAEPFGPIIHLTFRGRTGRILAEGVQGAGAEVGNCSPMYFSVEGREEKPLANGVSVIAIASQTLGVRLLAR